MRTPGRAARLLFLLHGVLLTCSDRKPQTKLELCARGLEYRKSGIEVISSGIRSDCSRFDETHENNKNEFTVIYDQTIGKYFSFLTDICMESVMLNGGNYDSIQGIAEKFTS